MQELFHLLADAVLATLLLIAVGCGVGFIGWQLSARHGSDVRTIWYLYFLAVISTSIVGAWATRVGAIDAMGSFQGAMGENINKVLDLTLDLNTDMVIMTAIAGLVLGPQIGSYLVSGVFFGCAAPLVLVGRTFHLYIWSSAKSFVVTAGILQSLSLYGLLHNWKGWNAKGTASMSALSLMLIMLALSMLYLYRDIADQQVAEASNTKLARANAGFHRFMTRRSNLVKASTGAGADSQLGP